MKKLSQLGSLKFSDEKQAKSSSFKLIFVDSSPQAELPDVFADDGMSAETIKEQEEKWTDLALQNLHDPQGSGQGS